MLVDLDFTMIAHKLSLESVTCTKHKIGKDVSFSQICARGLKENMRGRELRGWKGAGVK